VYKIMAKKNNLPARKAKTKSTSAIAEREAYQVAKEAIDARSMRNKKLHATDARTDNERDTPQGDDDMWIDESDSLEKKREKEALKILKLEFKGKSSVTYAKIGELFGWEPRTSWVNKKPREYKMKDGDYLLDKADKRIPVKELRKTDDCESAKKTVRKWKLKPTVPGARPPKFSCQKVAKKVAEMRHPE
jgi:hypothetical protein|tara:strand:+ start:134 stop:703 length:570 start_codon:yes stop_codon:yes gene_type:complete